MNGSLKFTNSCLTAKFAVAGIAALLSSGAVKADVFALNYEGPGIQHSTASFTVVGTENFDTRDTGGFTTDFGTGGAISAVYSGVQISSADQYGGAGGIGQYAMASDGTPYSLKLTSNAALLPKGINYFGYWLSALDAGNRVAFYREGVQVDSLAAIDVTSKVGSSGAYYGNPNAPFKGLNTDEPYVFINFYDTTGSFDEVRFTQNSANGRYESDNHTVGYYTAVGGVPEPVNWTLLIIGFGLIGFSSRRRTTNRHRLIAA